MRRENGTYMRRFAALILLCLLTLSLYGCAAAESKPIIKCLPDVYNKAYPEVLQELLPAYTIQEAEGSAFEHLLDGYIAEAFETQALSALEAGSAAYWYPQYLATAVIALDRDQTDAEIRGWQDLAGVQDAVSLLGGGVVNINKSALMNAMSYGLEGESYTLDSALQLLAGLYQRGLFQRDHAEYPILICFDYQAVRMLAEGRNLEVIVPAEGTLTLTRGLLSNSPIEFPDGVDAALLESGLRLPGGRAKSGLYPDEAAYLAAEEVTDHDHFNTVAMDTTRALRRTVFHTRLYTGADAREHQILALCYIALIIIWTASVIRRAMQQSVRRGALLICLIMVCWVGVRMVKYQTLPTMYWDRYLWFAYLGFQVSLAFVLLWMAWMTDRPEEGVATPKWLMALGGINIALALLVLTNDLHGMVYVLDFSNPLWRDDYGYAIGYHIISVIIAVQFVTAIVILVFKGIRNPNKRGMIFPLALGVLVVLYRYGYITRIPIARESDLTMVLGVFALLFLETAMRSGMIPVNTKYGKVFSLSPLSMQILTAEGKPALSSAAAIALDEQALKHVLSGETGPMTQDENTLLFSSPIRGGFAVWQEDIASLNRLHQETADSVSRIQAANALLEKEEKIKRAVSEEMAKRRLMEHLEAEIAAKTEELGSMIEALPQAANQPLETARLALLLCYIKRRCNLFFRERETDRLPADELAVYIDELAELAGLCGMSITTASELRGDLSVRQATLIYDFFYEMTNWAAGASCRYCIVYLGLEHGQITLRFLPSENGRGFQADNKLLAAIAAAGGDLTAKDLDDAVGVSLSFPESPEERAPALAGAAEGGDVGG